MCFNRHTSRVKFSQVNLKKRFLCAVLTLESTQGCKIYTMTVSALQIGEVAARCGVSVDTIRYYEKVQLIKPAPRSRAGFRIFPPEIIRRVKFIKKAQKFGFSLEEIRQFLAAGEDNIKCRSVCDLLEAKLAELDERIKAMRDFRRQLAQSLDTCEQELKAQGEMADCPVVANIEQFGKT